MSINIPTAYKTYIQLPYGELGEVVEWCRKNCIDEWKFHEHHNTMDSWSPEYTFYFENERDLVAFTLWKK